MKYSLHGLMIGFLVTTLWITPVVGQDLGGLESLVTGSTRGDGPGTMVLLLLKGIGARPPITRARYHQSTFEKV